MSASKVDITKFLSPHELREKYVAELQGEQVGYIAQRLSRADSAKVAMRSSVFSGLEEQKIGSDEVGASIIELIALGRSAIIPPIGKSTVFGISFPRSFLGYTGKEVDDFFGEFLRQSLVRNVLDVSGSSLSEQASTEIGKYSPNVEVKGSQVAFQVSLEQKQTLLSINHSIFAPMTDIRTTEHIVAAIAQHPELDVNRQ